MKKCIDCIFLFCVALASSPAWFQAGLPDSQTLTMLSEDWTVLSETAPAYPADNPRNVEKPC